MELQDTTAGLPLAMAYSMKIEPGGHRTVPLECNSKLEDQMTSGLMQDFTTETQIYIYPQAEYYPWE